MILFIDTSSFDAVRFALIGEKIKDETFPLIHIRAAETLKLLSKFLGKKKLEGVEKIVVVSGPGSFSGIRVGIALAEGFALATGVSVYAVTKDQIPTDLKDISKVKLKKITEKFDPEYGAEPNIIMKKK